MCSSDLLEFRETNVSLTSLVNPPADFDGVVVDRKGDVRALWSSFVVDNGRGESRQEAFGQPAALVTAMGFADYRTILEIASGDGSQMPSPANILSILNKVLFKTGAGNTSMTCFAAIMDARSGLFRYASAGHCAAYIQPKSGGPTTRPASRGLLKPG